LRPQEVRQLPPLITTGLAGTGGHWNRRSGHGSSRALQYVQRRRGLVGSPFPSEMDVNLG
jgi:hypothetical protein